jgi:hypothetical protein
VEKKKLTKHPLYLIIYCLLFLPALAKAQQQSQPLERTSMLYYEKYLNAIDEPSFHSAVKPYLSSEVYPLVYPPATYKLRKVNPETPFRKAINVIGYEDMVRFDETGYVSAVYTDTSSGAPIIMNRDEKTYVPRKFYISINPLFRLELGYDGNTKNVLFYNLRGIEVKADIGKKVSIYSAFLENQAEFPNYVSAYVKKTRSAPGEGKVRGFRQSGFDFSRAMGIVSYSPNKYFNVQFGNGKNFIGDGYRSLLLSDNSFVYPFMKFSTQFWKIKYVNIYTEFQNNIQENTDFTLGFPRKLGSFNYLSIDAARWLQLGLFEGMVWRRTKADGTSAFDPNFLNPIIGIRALQKDLDAKSVYGLNFKVTLPKYVVLYGQLMIDKISGGTGSSENRTGFQVGAKYYDAFGIENLVLQAEFNRVRPYAYQGDKDTILHYSHYNQALAHPLGANFNEALFIANYRIKRFVAEWKINYSNSAIDGLGFNVGSDILKNASAASFTDNVSVGQGAIAYSVINNEIRVGYLVNPKLNMMVEAKIQTRRYTFDPEVPGLEQGDLRMFSMGFTTRLFNHYYDLPINF